MTTQEKHEAGEQLAKVLKLRRDPEHPGRYQTEWGSKTARGVWEVVYRLVSEALECEEPQDKP